MNEMSFMSVAVFVHSSLCSAVAKQTVNLLLDTWVCV